MKFDHIVNYNGVYYAAGEEVPIDKEVKGGSENPPFTDNKIQSKTQPHIYTKEELEEIPVRKIRELATEKGFEIASTIKADVIEEFLSKQM